MPYPTNTLRSIGNRSADTINALRSSEGIKEQFRAFQDAVFNELHLLLLIYSGQRDHAKQWELYKEYKAGGVRAAKPGYSWHAYGRAIDVIPVFYSGKPNWKLPDSVWIKIEKLANRYGLQTGRSFNDPGHIKNTYAVSLASLRAANPGWEKYQVMINNKATGIAKGNWVKPAIYISLAALGIYGIFEYNKQRA